MSVGYLFGVGALILFWIFSYVVTRGKIAPWALAMSDSTVGGQVQGVLSVSKFQALVWTLVTLFAYASAFGSRLLDARPGTPLELPDIPINLLVLMGLTVATAAGSKGVTISYKSKGLLPERSGGLTDNPDGEPDLVKTQMLVWTIIAAGIYLLSVANYIAQKTYMGQVFMLPDVDGTLLVLMGASQGAYIGNKLVTREISKTPKVSALLPLKGPAGTTVTILGESFGETQSSNFALLDDRTVRSQADGLAQWSDLQIQVVIPSTCKAGDKIAVGVYRDGESSGRLFFDVT